VVGNGVEPVGHCALGAPGRPGRDHTPEGTAPTEEPVIAWRHNIDPSHNLLAAGQFHFAQQSPRWRLLSKVESYYSAFEPNPSFGFSG